MFTIKSTIKKIFLGILVIMMLFALLGNFVFSSIKTVVKEDTKPVYDLDDKKFIEEQKNFKKANNIKEDIIDYCYIKEYPKNNVNYKDLLAIDIDFFLPKEIPLDGSESGFLDIIVYDNYLKNLNNDRLKVSNIVIGKKEDINVELFLEEGNKQGFTKSVISGKKIKSKREVNLPTKSESYYNSVYDNKLIKNIKFQGGKDSIVKSIHCEFNIRDYSNDEKKIGILTALISIPFYDNRTKTIDRVYFKKVLDYNK